MVIIRQHRQVEKNNYYFFTFCYLDIEISLKISVGATIVSLSFDCFAMILIHSSFDDLFFFFFFAVFSDFFVVKSYCGICILKLVLDFSS